jgi:hypothetical protein
VVLHSIRQQDPRLALAAGHNLPLRGLVKNRRRDTLMAALNYAKSVEENGFAAATVEIGNAGSTRIPDKRSLTLSPTFLPGTTQRIIEVQRVTLAVTVEDLGKGIESVDTY